MAFLHGVETVQKVIGARQITVVKTAVVMLIGYAPKGAAQTLTLVTKDDDFSQFGSYLNGFTIPQALKKIFAKGKAGTVIVNNIYDTAVNDVTVTAEVVTLVGGKGASAFHPTNAVVVKDSTGTTTYVKDTDYSIDDYGRLTVIGTTIAQNAGLKFTYKKFDPTTVLAAAITGSITGDVRTGLYLFDEAKATFGFAGKILICPVYCGITAVKTTMESYINNKRACTLIHAPFGTSKATAIAGRGPSGTINFQTQNKRTMLLFPYLRDLSPIDDAPQYSEPSAYWAGVMCDSDLAFGPQRSVSNQELIGPIGTEIKITDELNDQNSDANLLNAQGISTCSMGSGAPFTWGNRNASFPNNTAIDSFLNVIRVSDIVAEAIEYYSRPFIDKEISKAIIDQIRDDVNGFIRVLISRGWLLDGICTWDIAKNPDSELAAGHLVFDYSILPPPPLERLTYNQTIDVNLFTKVLG
jgi:phage tail sheath protein FI